MKKFTVIHKSGWIADDWVVYGTYYSRSEAVAAIEEQSDYQRNDVDGDFYHTAIKEHYKQLSELTNYDNAIVTFNDGTIAVW